MDITEDEAKILNAVASTALQRPSELVWIYTKLKSLKPKTLLEIGTGCGATAFAWASLGCEVVTVDRVGNPIQWWEFRPEREKSKRISFILGDSNSSDIANQVKSLHESYDVVLIDGGHDWKTGARDYKNYAPLATKLIGIHDIGGFENRWDRKTGWSWFPAGFWWYAKKSE